eukprot:jgi/Astpho2/3343/Aster-04691
MQSVRPVQAAPPQPAAQPVAHTEEPVAKRQRVDEPQQQAEPQEVAPEALPTIPAPVTEGDVVEVKWIIADDEDETKPPTLLWWKAHIETVPASRTGPVHIRYEKMEDFDEEEADVEFIDKNLLRHMDNPDLLPWRFEGETRGDSEDDVNDTIGAQDLEEDSKELERAMGCTIEEVATRQLAQLPMDKQRQIASGFRNFADHFKEKLREKKEASGDPDYAVSADDVHSINHAFSHAEEDEEEED